MEQLMTILSTYSIFRMDYKLRYKNSGALAIMYYSYHHYQEELAFGFSLIGFLHAAITFCFYQRVVGVVYVYKWAHAIMTISEREKLRIRIRPLAFGQWGELKLYAENVGNTRGKRKVYNVPNVNTVSTYNYTQQKIMCFPSLTFIFLSVQYQVQGSNAMLKIMRFPRKSIVHCSIALHIYICIRHLVRTVFL